MPWREVSAMDQRREFVRLALQEGVNRRELCRRFGISPQVGYKWLARFAAGDFGVGRSLAATARELLAAWQRRPRLWRWRCAMRIRPGERARSPAALCATGMRRPPCRRCMRILRRNGRVVPPAGAPGQPFRRFEKEAPNLLWQMDFKGHMPLGDGASCHPLTMVDDHSRFALCLAACADEQGGTVRKHLETAFRRYGLPEAMFVRSNPGGRRPPPFHPWIASSLRSSQ